MWAERGSPDSDEASPNWGRNEQLEVTDALGVLSPRRGEREVDMRLIKRIAVAIGSLAALVLAGGAHMRF